MTQPDSAHEILPLDMNWRRGTDFAPHVLPADAEEGFTSGIPVEDVPDPIGENGLIIEGEEESDDDEEAGPKDSPVSEPAIVPASPTPPEKDAF